jgi:hypothetical protein
MSALILSVEFYKRKDKNKTEQKLMQEMGGKSEKSIMRRMSLNLV